LPIAFPNLVWDKYPHVELLAASTNFLIHDKPSLTEGDTTLLFQQVLQTVIPALISFGIKISLSTQEIQNLGITLQTENQTVDSNSVSKNPTTATKNPTSLIKQLIDLQQQQSLIISSLNTQIYNMNNNNSKRTDEPLHPDTELYSPKLLRDRYLGTQVWSTDRNKIKGVEEFELRIEKILEPDQKVNKKNENDESETIKIEGKIFWKRIHIIKLPGANEYYFKMASNAKINNIVGTEKYVGSFEMRKGLLSLQSEPLGVPVPDFELSHQYELLLNYDGTLLSGTSKDQNQGEISPIRAKAF
jgi:hypothetical protein